MSEKEKKNDITDERIEDTTMYGEFIPSFDQWITMDKQRRRVNKIEGVTDKNEGNQKKR